MKHFFNDNSYPLTVAGCGFVLAALFLTLGFFRTIFLLLLTVGGFFLGQYLERNGLFQEFMNNKNK